MKKKVDLWGKTNPSLKKLILEFKIAFLIIMVGISNVMAEPDFSEALKDDLISGAYSGELQQRQVTGTVTDENGSPLPGVSVVVKGTTLGTLTDVAGKFVLANTDQNAILVFSFIGMATQEVSVAGRTQIDLELNEEAIGLFL